MGSKFLLGDCQEVLARIPSNSVDMLLTDPPYGIGILGMEWDKPPTVEMFKEFLRIMKPGALAFLFTSYRQDVQAHMFNIMQQAGFKMSFTSIIWAHAQGYPKCSHIRGISEKSGRKFEELRKAYVGFQLKPAYEAILVGMKPPAEKSYSAQARKNGKGISWMDDCRTLCHKSGRVKGRFPANLIVSDGVLNDGKTDFSKYSNLDIWDEGLNISELPPEVQKTLPFLIVPQASRKEKEAGLDHLQAKRLSDGGKERRDSFYQQGGLMLRNNTHPCVKPFKLMTYLITMGSRKGDLVVDPFAGSGTICMAADYLKRSYLGVEINPEYHEIAVERLKRSVSQSLNLNGPPSAPLNSSIYTIDNNKEEVLMHKNLVGVKEMAAILNVPVSWIYARTRSKSIPCYKKDKYVRFDPEETIAWFKGITTMRES